MTQKPASGVCVTFISSGTHRFALFARRPVGPANSAVGLSLCNTLRSTWYARSALRVSRFFRPPRGRAREPLSVCPLTNIRAFYVHDSMPAVQRFSPVLLPHEIAPQETSKKEPYLKAARRSDPRLTDHDNGTTDGSCPRSARSARIQARQTGIGWPLKAGNEEPPQRR